MKIKKELLDSESSVKITFIANGDILHNLTYLSENSDE